MTDSMVYMGRLCPAVRMKRKGHGSTLTHLVIEDVAGLIIDRSWFKRLLVKGLGLSSDVLLWRGWLQIRA
jgi:hypothetical protein